MNWRAKRVALGGRGRVDALTAAGSTPAESPRPIAAAQLGVRERGRSGVGAAHVVASAAARSMGRVAAPASAVAPRRAAAGRPRGGPVPTHGRSSAAPRRSEGRAGRRGVQDSRRRCWMDLQSRASSSPAQDAVSTPMSVRVPTPAARPASLLAGLNDAQQRAAGFGIDSAARRGVAIGPLLIVAGAGIGQDADAGRARRPPRPRRRRPDAPPPADVLAPRRARDGAARRPRPSRGARPRRRCSRRRAWPGAAPSTASARACCAASRRGSASTNRSPSTTAPTPKT